MVHPKPPVTAIMPVRNDAKHLAAAVSSVLAQTYSGALDLVLAVGPSDDDTAGAAQELAAASPDRVTVVPTPSGGTAAGLNAALDQAWGEVIVRVDAHCELPSDYVATAVRALDETGAANVGGVQAAAGAGDYQRAVAAAMTSRFGVGDAKFHYGGDAGPTDTVYLGVFRSDVLREVGGFDESLARNQDYELNWRLRAAGHDVYFVPDMVVEYQPRDTPRALARQYFQYGQWKREVLRRHPRSLRLRQLAAPLTLVGCVLGVIGATTGRRWMLSAPATYLAAAGAAAAVTADSPAQAVRLAAVFPTMHLAWGAGFLVGPPASARQGAPLLPRARPQ